MRAVPASFSLASALATLALAGCGAASPPAAAPVVDVAIPVAPASAKPEGSATARYGVKGPDGETDPHIARQAALRDAAEFGQIGLLQGALDSGGVVGGVIGGVPGGVMGGIGIGGSGIGGGGSGIGIGSIGTIGRGSGTGSGYGMSSNPVGGSSITVYNGIVVEMGDSATLGLSVEQATRALRDRVPALRSCYESAFHKSSKLAGSVAFRLVVASNGRITYARVADSTLTDKEAVACMSKAFKDVYVGSPSGSFYGVVETVIAFHPAPTK